MLSLNLAVRGASVVPSRPSPNEIRQTLMPPSHLGKVPSPVPAPGGLVGQRGKPRAERSSGASLLPPSHTLCSSSN